uniref:uncharacterized protein LOC122585761 n=1 Tax=Erigeron canadensis TaxID=72917 RepID=UPI001CB8CEBA|nr:uncharacterized protein LOC122585761 [Erigeron canadensis]
MKPTSSLQVSSSSGDGELVAGGGKRQVNNNNNKPQFRPAIDDSKPLLQDPIVRSDPTETEEAVIRLPNFPTFS